MDTKKCSKCGWEYPIMWSGLRCRFCKEPMKVGPCHRCGKLSYNLFVSNGWCRECRTEHDRGYTRKMVTNAEQQFAEHLELIKKIPTPYKTLTEEDWIKACAYFGGCAYCGDDHIATRDMFVAFKDGGRYCNWNIVPACEQCAKVSKSNNNPFNRMNDKLNRNRKTITKKYGYDIEKLQKVADYLQSRISEVLNESESKT